MLYTLALTHVKRALACAQLLPRQTIARRYKNTKSSEALRILFCGSDEFSIRSLEAIHKLHLADPTLISSIDVVSRPPKPYGRGLKKIREVPIVAAAHSLRLPLHQIDTFTGWAPPAPINLIIAVSFGLLVPPRLLSDATYGGLNIHPSLLPDLRGAAPIQWTLLHARPHTGVTLQTLHPSKMDHGQILLQTPQPGISTLDADAPRGPQAPPGSEHFLSAPRLTSMLAQAGADMLVQGLRERLFVPPLHPMQHSRRQAERAALEPAPKITPEHRRVQLKAWSAAELVRRAQTIGPLWSHASPTIARQDGIKAAKRVIWSSGFELVDDGEASGTALGRGVDKRPGAVFRGRNGDGLYLVAADCRLVRARRAKVEGRADMDAVAVGNLIAGGKESKEGDEGQEGSGIELLDLVTG